MESSIGPSIESQAFIANQHRNGENEDHSGNGDSAVDEREIGLDNIMENLNDEDDHSIFQASDDSDDSNVNSSSLSSKLKKQSKSHVNFGSNILSSAVSPSSAAYPKYGNALLSGAYSNAAEYSSQAGLKSIQHLKEQTNSNIQPTQSGDYYQRIISKQSLGNQSKYSESNEHKIVKCSSQFESNLHINSGSVSDHQSATGKHVDFKSGITYRDSNNVSTSNFEEILQISASQSNIFPKVQVPSKIPLPDSRHLEDKFSLNSDKYNTTAEGYSELWKKFSDQRQEIMELKKSLEEIKDNSKRELRILQSQAMCTQTENERLKAFIQQKDRVLSDLKQENISLKGNLAAVDLEVKAERKAKEEVIKKLECAEVTIKSLDIKLAEFARSEKRTRYKEQHEKIINDLKQRHSEEILNLKNDIKELKIKSESKDSKIDALQQHLDEAMHKCETLFAEKSEVHHLNASVVQSDTNTAVINEVTRLKRRIIDLEIKQKDLENENSYLKKMGDCVKSEIEGRHSIDSLQIRLEALDEEWRTRKHEEPPVVRRSVENVEAEMQRTFQVLAAQKAQNERLINQLKGTKNERDELLARSKFFEKKWDEENKKCLDVEEKWLQAIPAGTIPCSQHDKEIQAIQMVKTEVETQLKDVQIRLKEVSDNEAYLNELTRRLRAEMVTIVKQHDEDKKNAMDVYARVQTEEREKLDKTYEKEISRLKKEIEQLENGTILQKDRLEQKEISLEIRGQLKDIVQDKERSEQLDEEVESKTELETRLREELEIEREKWEIERQQEVTAFIMEMKKKLVAEYDDYIEQEKKKILQQAEEEKQQIIELYDKKLDKSNKEEKRLSRNEEMEKIIKFYEVKCEQMKEVTLKDITIAHQKEIETINQIAAAALNKSKKELKLKCQEQADLISKYRKLYKQEVETRDGKVSEVKESLSVKFQSLLKMAESEISELKMKIQNLTHEKTSLSKELQISASAAIDKKQNHDEVENNLKNALKTANETITQLHGKKEKYATYSAKLKVEVNEIRDKLKVKERLLHEKESSYQGLLKKIEDFHEREISYKLKLQSKKTAIGICQTEEAMVPKKIISAMRDKCVYTITCMTSELNSQMKVSQNRVSNSLQQCMKVYQDLLCSIVLDGKTSEFDNALREIEIYVLNLLETYRIPRQPVETFEVHGSEERFAEKLKIVNPGRDSEENLNIGLQPLGVAKDNADLTHSFDKKRNYSKLSMPSINISCDPLSTNPKKVSQSVQARVSRQRRSRDFHNKKGIETLKPSSISSRTPTPEIAPNAPGKSRRSRSMEATSRSAHQPQLQIKHKSKHASKLSKKDSGTDSPHLPEGSTSNPEDTLNSSTLYHVPNSPLNELADSFDMFFNQLRQMDRFKF